MTFTAPPGCLCPFLVFFYFHVRALVLTRRGLGGSGMGRRQKRVQDGIMSSQKHIQTTTTTTTVPLLLIVVDSLIHITIVIVIHPLLIFIHIHLPLPHSTPSPSTSPGPRPSFCAVPGTYRPSPCPSSGLLDRHIHRQHISENLQQQGGQGLAHSRALVTRE